VRALSLGSFDRRRKEMGSRFEESSRVRQVIDHECREGDGGV
jgi:hypothetical protein